MDHVEYVYTAGIDDEDVTALLNERDHGVLALASGDAAYAVPVHYHFDGETMFFRLGERDGSTKIEFANATDVATLVIYDGDAETAWSVLVRGPVRRLSDAEREGYDDAEINERFPPFHLFDEDLGSLEIALYELTPESITGRRTAQ